MDAQMYNKIVETYQARQKKRLLIALAMVIVGALTAVSVVGAVVCIVGVVYLMIEGIRTVGLYSARKKNIAQLKSTGEFDQAMLSLSNGLKQGMDGLTYAWSEDYFLTGYGAIFNMKQIAWVFPFTHTTSYFFIPIVRQHWCKALLLDGTERIVFYGKAKDKAAFETLLRGMLAVNPDLLIGHTPENQKLYSERVQQYKEARNA